METSYHMGLDVTGFLKNQHFPRAYRKMFKHLNGSEMTPNEAREALFAELARGHKMIPIGDCPIFDFVKGCPGHPDGPKSDPR
jgi:hypothetical protein